MLLFLIACVVSFIPCIVLFLRLRKSHVGTGDEGEITFIEVCNKALRQGIFTVWLS